MLRKTYPDIYKQPCFFYEIHTKLWDGQPWTNKSMILYMFVCVCSSPSNGGDGGGRQGPEGGGDSALCSAELLRFFSLSALRDKRSAAAPRHRGLLSAGVMRRDSSPRWLLCFPKWNTSSCKTSPLQLFSSLRKTKHKVGIRCDDSRIFHRSFVAWPLVTGSCSRRTLCSFNEPLLFRAKLLTIDLFGEFRPSTTSSYFIRLSQPVYLAGELCCLWNHATHTGPKWLLKKRQ